MDRVPPERLRAVYHLPEEDDALLAECEVAYFRSPGPGGQHKNRTMTSVRLHHLPSGLVVIGRRERSQRRNLADALRRLREKLERLLTPPKPRKPTRPTSASRERRLEEKQRRGKRKRERSSRNWED